MNAEGRDHKATTSILAPPLSTVQCYKVAVAAKSYELRAQARLSSKNMATKMSTAIRAAEGEGDKSQSGELSVG